MKEPQNIIYTAADLQRYHSGSMTEAEMHALEKAAMDDPFLAEALEGYAYTSSAENDLLELKKRLQENNEKKKVFILFSKKNMAWLSAAAVLVFILGTVFITLKLNTHSNEVKLAKNEDRKQKQVLEKASSDLATENKQSYQPTPADTLETTLAKPAPKQDVGLTALDETYTVVVPKANQSWASEPPGKFEGAKVHQADSVAIAKTIVAEQSSASAVSPEEQETVRTDVAADAASRKEKTSIEDDKFSNPKAVYRISGRVIDDAGNAVAFASLTDSSRRSNFTTDVAGKFSIAANDSSLFATIAAVGYNTLKKDLKSNLDQTIVLSRNSQELASVVVTSQGVPRQKASLGYSKKRVEQGELEGKVAGISVMSNSEPVIGKLKYQAALADSIKKLKAINKELIEGIVLLSFNVKKNGELKNIRVEKKLCAACDEEAIRLLRAGSKWKYVGDKRSTITINF
ncbi:MAG: carboxypeptidase-like regulatory domain-containing protein [Ferruginibacter sp.]